MNKYQPLKTVTITGRTIYSNDEERNYKGLMMESITSKNPFRFDFNSDNLKNAKIIYVDQFFHSGLHLQCNNCLELKKIVTSNPILDTIECNYNLIIEGKFNNYIYYV